MNTGVHKPVQPLRFTGVFVAATIAVAVLAAAIEYFLNLTIPNSATAFVPLFAAALNEGQKYARSGARELSKQQAWQGAFQMAVISILISLGGAAVFVIVFQAWDAVTIVSPLIWGAILAVLFGLSILVCRSFLGLGFRTERKQLDKAAATK